MQVTNSDQATLEIIEDLYRTWKPNKGQLIVGRELFVNKKKTLFIRWGRKGGKTDFIISAIWRHALLNPNSACYYFTPLIKQAREILWSTNRLQHFMPKKYVLKILNNEMRIRLKNGSFIKLDGSDNFESYRGTLFDIAVYDEFKDFDPRFHDAFNPNRLSRDGILIILGTPPVSVNDDRNYNQYKAMEKECQSEPDSFYLKLSTYNNVENIPGGEKALEAERQKLIDRGEEYRWVIEYLAEDVKHGKFSVFPMLNEKRHVKPHDALMEVLRRDKKKLEWFCVTDPGTATVFAVLFGCLNPYSKEIFLLDCIYARDRDETSTGKVLPRIHAIINDLYPGSDAEEDWMKTCDEAAAWFMNEALTYFKEEERLTFNPTNKRANTKENGISLIKDILTYELVSISDRCVRQNEGLYWEMQHYSADETGKYPKKNDHLIDCLRYFLDDVAYDMTEALEAKKTFKGPLKLQSKEDLHEIDLDEDWTSQFD
jgi:hypothetical protein